MNNIKRSNRLTVRLSDEMERMIAILTTLISRYEDVESNAIIYLKHTCDAINDVNDVYHRFEKIRNGIISFQCEWDMDPDDFRNIVSINEMQSSAKIVLEICTHKTILENDIIVMILLRKKITKINEEFQELQAKWPFLWEDWPFVVTAALERFKELGINML